MANSSITNTSGCTYRFIDSSLSLLPEEIEYNIEIRQQPVQAKMSIVNERDKRYIEPPPILQLHFKNCSSNELKTCLQSPFYFAMVHLVYETDTNTLLPIETHLSGSTVSSLNRLRDTNNTDGGFFIFSDLAVKKEGKFKLKFSLFEIVDGQVQNRQTLLSDTFTVYLPKKYPGPIEVTFLSRTFSDQGVKMKIRKESILQSRKRKSNETTETNSSSTKKTNKKAKHFNNKSFHVQYDKWHVKHAANNSTTPSSASSSPSLVHTNYANTYRNYHHHNPENYIDDHYPNTNCYSSKNVMYPSFHSNEYDTYYPDMNTATPMIHPLTLEMSTLDVSTIKHYSYDKKYDWLPTPPPISDLHQLSTGKNTWGNKLPPLKVIMDEAYNANSLNIPLLLPPPIPSMHF